MAILYYGSILKQIPAGVWKSILEIEWLQKNNQGRSLKLSVWQKKNILQQIKCLQEDIGNFSVKRVMVKADISPSIIQETICRVLRKTGLKCTRVQRKGILTKNDWKLRLKFSRKVLRKRAICNYEKWNHQKTHGTRESRS